MRFIKNNIWTFCLVAVFTLLSFSGDALAQSSVMSLAQTKAKNVFSSVKTIIFIVGGFGLVGIAFAAIFGKINWKWFASLAVGLAIVAAAASIINYATGDDSGLSMSEDTFSSSAVN